MKGLLKDLYPDVAAEWHPTKNYGKYSLETMSGGNPNLVWWLDALGHEWEARVAGRTRSDGKRKPTSCPYCAGKKILLGFNDLATLKPHIATEWHPTKNLPALPTTVGLGFALMVHWECSLTHEWKAPLYGRNQGTGCPVCAGSAILSGFNDLATKNPQLASEWHPTLNGDLTAAQVGLNTNKKAWWLASCGHEWEAVISSRSLGKGCPVCSNRKIITGFNDLASLNPKVAAEWHPDKNAEITPQQVGAGYTRKVWWLASCGHEWETAPEKRSAGTNCPTCSNRVSKAEKEIFAHLVGLGLNAVQSDRKILGGKELDIYLPDQKLAIEYNGLYYHTEQGVKTHKRESVRLTSSHYDKWLACKDAGIQLIQIWEDDWVRNKPGVLKALEHKLNVNRGPRVFARKTRVIDLTTKEARAFLDVNHLQGFASGSYYLGLADSGGVFQAVMVLKKDSVLSALNIVRYATSSTVVGGFTKLLSYAERTFSPDLFYTFSDHTISDGSLYANNGFTAVKELKADYMYVVKGVRKHKFGYRLKRFRADPDLLWMEGLTERELAEVNDIPRIWDAGKTKWEKKVFPKS